MDRLEAMSVLVAAAESGSLSAAGRRLHMPLATVSRKVSELEALLKTRLLNRSTRRLALTDSGRSFVEAAKRILASVEEAERAASGEYNAPRGELVITAPVLFGRLHVLPIALEFLSKHPEIDIRLALSDRILDLLEEHVDLGVRIGNLPDSSLIAREVGTIRRVVCASPAHFAEHGMPQHPRDLTRHPCVTFAGGLAVMDQWRFWDGKAAMSVPIRSRLTVNNAEAAVEAASAGVGLARVLSYQAAAALGDGRLALALTRYEPPSLPVNLVYGAGRLMPLKLRVFIDFAAPRLKERLAKTVS